MSHHSGQFLLQIFGERNSTYSQWTAISPDLEKFRLIVFLGGNNVNKYLEIILDVMGVGIDVQKDPELRFKMIEILHFLVEEAAKGKAENDESSANWTVDGVGEKILNDVVNKGLVWRNGGGNSKVRKGIIWFLEKTLQNSLIKSDSLYSVRLKKIQFLTRFRTTNSFFQDSRTVWMMTGTQILDSQL